MMKLTALVLSLIVAAALAAEPAPGDLGTISQCVPTADDEECMSCFEEREEEEEEEGEEKEPEAGSAVQKCVDTCSASGYRITQLEDATMLNRECEMNGGEDCEEVAYQRVDITPAVNCVNGCACPNATGFMVKPEANDEEAADEDQEYDLVFWDMEGEPDTAFTGGVMTIAAAEDGVEQINQVTLEIKYTVTEIKDDDAAEEEQREMDCRVPFFIATGKVGGTPAVSGEPVPEVPATPDVIGEGQLKFTAVEPAACGEFAEGTPEFCFAFCTGSLQVHTKNASFMMVPDDGFDENGCECTWGKGFQKGQGEVYTHAQVSFGENYADMCTSTFNSEIVEVNVMNADFKNAFTLEWKTTGEEPTTCTSSYKITKGAVLGRAAAKAAGSGGAAGPVAGIIIGVIVVVALIVAVVKRKGGKRSYQGIP